MAAGVCRLTALGLVNWGYQCAVVSTQVWDGCHHMLPDRQSLKCPISAGHPNPAGPCKWHTYGLYTSVASVEGCAGELLAALALFVCLVGNAQASDITFEKRSKPGSMSEDLHSPWMLGTRHGHR